MSSTIPPVEVLVSSRRTQLPSSGDSRTAIDLDFLSFKFISNIPYFRRALTNSGSYTSPSATLLLLF
jgi:hypothetical protein